MLLCLREPPVMFLWCCLWLIIHFWYSFCCYSSFCCHFCCSSFIPRLLYYVTGTPLWLLDPWRPAQALSSNLDFFWLPLLFHLLRALRFWVGNFYPQGFSTLRSLTDILLRLSRPPWEPAVFPCSLLGLMLILETQSRPIRLFDSQQSTMFIFRKINF